MLIQISLSEAIANLPKFATFLEGIVGGKIIRWGGVGFDNKTQMLSVEVVLSGKQSPKKDNPHPPILSSLLNNVNRGSQKNLGALIIPTGLGCSIGGFGGDANPIANLLAQQFDYLIVNPNVVNGGAWQNIAENMLYVEGFAIDLFMQGQISLRPVRKNQIGLIIDKSIPEELIRKELEVVKAAQTIWGIDFLDYEITNEPLNQIIEILPGSYSSGKIDNPLTLIEAAKKLIEKGASAIAILTLCPEYEESNSSFPLSSCREAEALAHSGLVGNNSNYDYGLGADPIAGLEAICSHIITNHFLIPCAHAPTFAESTIQELTPRLKFPLEKKGGGNACSKLEEKTKGSPVIPKSFQDLLDDPPLEYSSIDSRVSPEIASFSFLPSVFRGLQRAPQLIPIDQAIASDLTINELKAFIGPSDCWLGQSFLSAGMSRNPELKAYSIESNKTKIGISADLLKLHSVQKTKNYFEVIGYLEAEKAGMIINRF
jgi:hypothetical protein